MEIIRTEEWGNKIVRVGKCCGKELYLDGFTNTCDSAGRIIIGPAKGYPRGINGVRKPGNTRPIF